MSAFKRHQSKVFWNQMATHDLGRDSFPGQAYPFAPRDTLPRIKREIYEFPEEDAEDRSSSINENDTTDGCDITAIHVGQKNNEQQNTKTSTSISESIKIERKNHKEAIAVVNASKEGRISAGARNRSSSPLSHDLRSLDSGFSDSERSNCSETYENETPRRKHRRKKIKDRQHRTHARLGALSLEDEVVPNPTFTSTPKDSKTSSRTASHFKLRLQRNLKAQGATKVVSDASAIASSSSMGDECMGDFLYASEPPEDPIEPRNNSLVTSTFSEGNSACQSSFGSRSYRQSSSIRAWLNHLAMDTESECGSALQSKSLPRRKQREIFSQKDETKDLKALSSMATAAASKLLVRADRFDQHYQYIYDKVSHLEAGKSERELIRAIEDDAFSVLSELGAPPPRRIHQSSLRGILSELEAMKNYIDGALNTRLDFYIERVVRGLEEAPNEDITIARGALAALTALGLAGTRAGSSIARCSGIRALLTSLITTGRTSIDFVASSLRALASVCSSAIAIDRFAKDGGPEIVTDLLVSENASEKEKMEATALVVQITATWSRARGLPYLEPFANILIPSLNKLAESTSCGQTLLLVAAAFNNLSKSRACANIIIQHDTVRRLLKSVKKSTGRNVWLMEQVAALISELARIPEARRHLAKARASVALVSFLRMRPPGLEMAYNRLEITAAAALTRLCVDPEIASQVVAVGGADCLPSYNVDDLLTEDEDQVEAGLLKYTKSLRRACKSAAKQIDIAKACDYSTLT